MAGWDWNQTRRVIILLSAINFTSYGTYFLVFVSFFGLIFSLVSFHDRQKWSLFHSRLLLIILETMNVFLINIWTSECHLPLDQLRFLFHFISLIDEDDSSFYSFYRSVFVTWELIIQLISPPRRGKLRVMRVTRLRTSGKIKVPSTGIPRLKRFSLWSGSEDERNGKEI